MGYSMQFDGQAVNVENDFFSPHLLESSTSFRDDTMSLFLQDTSLSTFHLIAGQQKAKVNSNFSINFDTSFYVSHFILGNSITEKGNNSTVSSTNTYKTYYQNREQTEKGFLSSNQNYEFFELAFRKSIVDEMIEDDDVYSQKMYSAFATDVETQNPSYLILPKMHQCISELNSNPFKGQLAQLYMETKATELYLLTMLEMQNEFSNNSKLKPRDVESLHEARLYVENNYHTPCSIIDLAKIVGINQTKLKSGFKELFGTTIFGYVRNLQMEKAKQLLLDEKLYVNEVADQVGYKHPQHFAAAFKRKFGVLPSELKV